MLQWNGEHAGWVADPGTVGVMLRVDEALVIKHGCWACT